MVDRRWKCDFLAVAVAIVVVVVAVVVVVVVVSGAALALVVVETGFVILGIVDALVTDERRLVRVGCGVWSPSSLPWLSLLILLMMLSVLV